MITSEQLAKSGFKFYRDEDIRRENKFYVGTFQKASEDEEGVRYYITIHEYNYKGLIPDSALNNYRYSSSATMRKGGSHPREVVIQYPAGDDVALLEMEAFYLGAWSKLNFDHIE